METVLGELKYMKYPIEKNKVDNIWFDMSFKDYFEAPVQQNTKIGTMKVGIDTTEIMDVDILNFNKIARKSVKDYFVELMGKYRIR